MSPPQNSLNLFIFGSARSSFTGSNKQGLHSLVVEHRLLTAVASRCRARPLGHVSSVVVAQRLSCSRACGIFPNWGSNPCPLHWQVDSFLLTTQEVLHHRIFFFLIVSVKLYHSRKQIFLRRKTTLLTTTLTKGSQPLHASLPGQVSPCLQKLQNIEEKRKIVTEREKELFLCCLYQVITLFQDIKLVLKKSKDKKINQPCVSSMPPQNSSPAVYSGSPVLGCDGENKKYVQEMTPSIKKIQPIL